MRLTVIGLLELALVVHLSCAAQGAEQRQTNETVSLPAGLSYVLIDSVGGGRGRLVLNILLSEKQSEAVLQNLAVSLRNSGRTHYQYFTVNYKTPGQTIGYWAIVELAPSPKTQIVGLLANDEAKLLAEQIPSSREVLGRWINDGVAGGLLTIFRDRGRSYLEQRFSDGGALKIELIERPSRAGRRFDRLESRSGDHWLVNAVGVLEIRDNDGLIATGRPIR